MKIDNIPNSKVVAIVNFKQYSEREISRKKTKRVSFQKDNFFSTQITL